MAFTIIDVIFLLVVLILCIRAAAKGFLDEVFGLGTFIVGAYFSVYLMPFLKPYLASCMNETLAAVLSFLILFIAIFLIMKIIFFGFFLLCRGEIRRVSLLKPNLAS